MTWTNANPNGKWVSNVAVPVQRKNKGWKALRLSSNLINWYFFLILMFLFKQCCCTDELILWSKALCSQTGPSLGDGQPGLWVDSFPPRWNVPVLPPPEITVNILGGPYPTPGSQFRALRASSLAFPSQLTSLIFSPQIQLHLVK